MDNSFKSEKIRTKISLDSFNPKSLTGLESFWRKTALRVVNDNNFSDVLSGVKSYKEELIDELIKKISAKSSIEITKNNIAIAMGYYEIRMWIWHYIGGAKNILVLLGLDDFSHSTTFPLREDFRCPRPEIKMSGDNHFFTYEPFYSSIASEKKPDGIWLTNPHIPSGIRFYADNIKLVKDMLLGSNGHILIESPSLYSIIEKDEERSLFYLYDRTIYLINFADIGIGGENFVLVIGPEDLITNLNKHIDEYSFNPSSFTTTLLYNGINTDELSLLIKTTIYPIYQHKREIALSVWQENINPAIPYSFSRADNIPYLWLWLSDLNTSTKMFSNLMEKEGISIISGDNFFPVAFQSWKHSRECFLVNLIQDDDDIVQGVKTMASVVNRIYHHNLL